MSSSQTPHRTPLRRVSQGSLFALSRSAAYPDAPHGLGFIEPAMAELTDEVEALHANTEGIENLSNSLATFNESFASYLYVMTMNALTTDWPQGPTEGSFVLEKKRRAEQEALRAMEALKAAQAKEASASRESDPTIDKTTITDYTETDTTFTTPTNVSTQSSVKSGAVVKKKGGKAKMTAKEKKERSVGWSMLSRLPLTDRIDYCRWR
ncbi:hypothetical protein AX15_005922 [Amanita polypyramis BW_CC]|nr:hypothetical protein AX15_005922 [Amanita polypyramis BW_CC]